MRSPTGRFTGRVSDYARYRPRYPEDLLRRLASDVLTPGFTVADIGSGTGIFTRQIHPLVHHVFAVEPNAAMREYSTGYLDECQNVSVAEGTAEKTGLPSGSVDVVTAAQAFHWFDRGKARAEFRRILSDDGHVILLWYERITKGDLFMEGYEELLLKHGVDYTDVDHRKVTPELIRDFFRPGEVTVVEYQSVEPLDFGQIRGRLLSASYVPAPTEPGFPDLMDGINQLFKQCNLDGSVVMRNRVKVYIGKLPPD